MIVTKNTKNNGVVTIKEISYDIAKEITIKNHYSKKWNTSFGKLNFGIFKEDRLLGVAVFGNLMNPNSHAKITDEGKESVIELNRMWIDDELGMNAETILISSSIKIIKNKHKHIKYIQSFADGRLGCGTIYKASNFKYFGYEETLFFEDSETGEVFHKVPLENTKRPLGFMLKNKRYLDGKLKPFTTKTYKYIYTIYSSNSLKLKPIPYPEYDKGLNYMNYTHGLGLLVRLCLMYKAINDDEYYIKTKEYIKSLKLDNNIIKLEVEKQNKNESYLWFINEYIKNKVNVDKLLSNNFSVED